LFERQEFLSLYEGSSAGTLWMLELFANIFHKNQDAEYYYRTISLLSLVRQGDFPVPSLGAKWSGIDSNPVLNNMRGKLDRAFQVKDDSMKTVPSIEALKTPTCSLLTLIEYSEIL